MSIQEHLNKIRNAKKGIEVRESIAKGIETAYDDASEKDNANMEVKLARGTNPNLNTRLNKMDETDRQNAGRIDSNYNEVTAQLAQTQIEKVGGGVKADLEDLSGEVLSAIEGGEGTSFELLSIPQDKSVTPIKTTFAISGGGINLFDGEFYGMSLQGGSPFAVLKSENALSAIVKLTPNTDYTFSKTDDTERFRLAFFEEKPTVGSVPSFYKENDAYQTYTYTTKTSEKYVLIQVTSTGLIPSRLQVEKGIRKSHELTPVNRVKIDLHKSSFSEFMQKSQKNLFDGNYYSGFLRGGGEHQLQTYTARGIYTLTKVEPNTTYSVSKYNDETTMQVGTFIVNPKELDAPTSYHITSDETYTMTTGGNDHYLLVGTAMPELESPAPLERFQIEKGLPSSYEPPYIFKKGLLPENHSSEDTPTVNRDKYYVAGNLRADYDPITPAPPIDNTLKLDVIYSWYDDLVDRHPDKWTKTLLATETSGLPVYRYDYKTQAISGGVRDKTPKILHLTGMHGDEKHSIAGAMRFYKDLSDEWTTNVLLQTLASSVHFIVIPAFNAWGVDRNTRGNVNGIDLNRDFPENWEYTDDSYGLTSGDYPLSQPESVAMMNLIETETDIVFAVDHHRDNPYALRQQALWTATKNNIINDFLVGWSKDVQFDFLKMHPELEEGNETSVRVLKTARANTRGNLGDTFVLHGIPGTIMEFNHEVSLNDFHTKAMVKLFAYAIEEFGVKGTTIS